jgi:hypothetical protein
MGCSICWYCLVCSSSDFCAAFHLLADPDDFLRVPRFQRLQLVVNLQRLKRFLPMQRQAILQCLLLDLVLAVGDDLLNLQLLLFVDLAEVLQALVLVGSRLKLQLAHLLDVRDALIGNLLRLLLLLTHLLLQLLLSLRAPGGQHPEALPHLRGGLLHRCGRFPQGGLQLVGVRA